MLIAAPSIIADICKQSSCPPTGEQIKKSVIHTHTHTHTHPTEYCSFIKRIKSSHLWQNGWNWTTVFDISETQEDKYHEFSLL